MVKQVWPKTGQARCGEEELDININHGINAKIDSARELTMVLRVASHQQTKKHPQRGLWKENSRVQGSVKIVKLMMTKPLGIKDIILSSI